ncbi:MAG: [Fe-S]-binding protein [Phycisphaeraceae bacterium]|nr:[Fe-S]-binding protein [Phycisphaeraceae bacterium]
MVDSTSLPHVFRVRQRFDTREIEDVPGEVTAQLSGLSLGDRIRPGQSVAIAAGSRGIWRIHEIIRAMVEHVKGLGAEPFIVPAMGSHAAGRAEGQKKVLESYGITESFCGCPIRSSMKTVVICEAAEGFAVHFDRHAHGADHVLLCNRVKPHTQFAGEIESGLMKMMLPGLGKHDGARVYHRAIQDFSFARILRSVTSEILSRCPVTAGVAIVENSAGRTAILEAIPAERIEAREKKLLVEARRLMPRLPFESADVLLIDRAGKNISGTGIDVNVVGRKHHDHESAEDEYPKVRLIALRSLTPESRGNGEGMGLIEFCLTRFLEQVDVETTRINGLTSGHFTGAMTPLDYPTDRALLDVMLHQIGLTDPPDARLLWIDSTQFLTEVECGAVYLAEARQRDDLEILTRPRPLPLDEAGKLPDGWFGV